MQVRATNIDGRRERRSERENSTSKPPSAHSAKYKRVSPFHSSFFLMLCCAVAPTNIGEGDRVIKREFTGRTASRWRRLYNQDYLEVYRSITAYYTGFMKPAGEGASKKRGGGLSGQGRVS